MDTKTKLIKSSSQLLVLDITETEAGLGWLNVLPEPEVRDRVMVDLFLVSIFRKRLKNSTTQTRTIALLDLLLCCGEDEHALILSELQKVKHLGIVFAIYWRVAMLYFFRHHRDKDRGNLRKLLSDIRKMERRQLPKLV